MTQPREPNPAIGMMINAGLQNLSQRLKKAAETAQTQATPATPATPLPDPEAPKTTQAPRHTTQVTGELPMPNSQTVGEEAIVWQWDIAEEITVIGLLVLKDNSEYDAKPQDYFIQLVIDDPSKDSIGKSPFTFTGDYGKTLGEALVAAHQWQYVWKLHAGDLLLAGLSEKEKND